MTPDDALAPPVPGGHGEPQTPAGPATSTGLLAPDDAAARPGPAAVGAAAGDGVHPPDGPHAPAPLRAEQGLAVRRIVAAAVDGVLVVVVAAVLAWLVARAGGAYASSQGERPDPARQNLLRVAGATFLPLVWGAVLALQGRRGATPGMALTGLRLLRRRTGRPVGGWNAVIRVVLYGVVVVLVACRVLVAVFDRACGRPWRAVLPADGEGGPRNPVDVLAGSVVVRRPGRN